MDSQRSGAYSPQSPESFDYTDRVSSIYPDRPIRPLPKRRIKARLSTNEGSSDTGSSPLASAPRLFRLPSIEPPVYTDSHRSSMEVQASEGGLDEHGRYDFKGNGEAELRELLESHERLIRSLPIEEGAASLPTPLGGSVAKGGITSSRSSKAIIAKSIPSSESIDGYDSFENTNNKKKRKIPTSGAHSATLSLEMASMGLSTSRDMEGTHVDHDGGVSPYYGSGSSATPAKIGTTVPGAGRGRYRRTSVQRRSARSPLGVSVNGSNYVLPDKTAALNTEEKDFTRTGTDISSVQLRSSSGPQLSHPNTGQENNGRQQRSKPGSGKTQFTFTCESEATKSMQWPGYAYTNPRDNYQRPQYSGPENSYQHDDTTSGYREDPTRNGLASGNTKQQQMSTTPLPPLPRRPRRPLVKQYALAARDRKLRQNYNNFHHPPRVEDVWICAYCEYESIFGGPPEALIRQYEIKDRRERRRLAEKRRLLEKAKMKGKKGKKGSKANHNSSVTNQSLADPSKLQNDPTFVEEELPPDPQDLQGDEYLLDDNDDRSINLSPQPLQSHARIPHPASGRVMHEVHPPAELTAS